MDLPTRLPTSVAAVAAPAGRSEYTTGSATAFVANLASMPKSRYEPLQASGQ